MLFGAYIVTIDGQDYVYRAADIQASGADVWGLPKQTAEDTKNNINISKEDLGNGKTRWTVLFFPHKGLQNVNSNTSGLTSAKLGIALTSDYQIVGNVDMEVISDPKKSFVYYAFDGNYSATKHTVQKPSDEIDFSFNPKTDVDPNTGLINSETMPAYNNEYLQGPYYFTTATDTGKKNLWRTYFEFNGENKNAYEGSPYLGNNHDLNFNIFKIANETGVDGAKYADPIIYDTANSKGVFSSDNFTQAMEFKSQGTALHPQFSSYVISFITQHTDSHEVKLATGWKNQQFSGISANIYSKQNTYWNMYSSLYGEQRALNADGEPLKAKDIIPNWDDAKAANKAIDDALVNKKGEINSATNIDQATKDNLIKEATDAAGAAKNTISQATTADAIKKAQDDGVSNINNVKVPSLDDAKSDANKAINTALADKKTAINDTNLTAEEQTALVNQAQKLADDAIANINQAKTNDAVNTAKETGVETINNINVPTTSATKDAANKAIDDALNKKQSEINGATNIDQTTKDTLSQAATEAAGAAKNAIGQATTADAIKKAQDDGISNINNVKVPSLEDAKTAANNAIDNALTNKTNEINNASNLSDQEKQALVNKATDAANTAKDNIAKATTNDAVKDAETKGLNDINNIKVPSLAEKQQEAKDAVAKAADAKNQAIDNSNLTSDEKTALKKQVSDAQTAANKAIDDASTDAEVTKAQNDGIDNINKIAIPETSDAKAKATTDLKDTVDNAKKAIDQDTNLTNDQKQAAKDQIDTDAKNAQDAIDNAKNDADVTKTTNDGQLNIDKTVANAAIDNAAAAKKDAIKAAQDAGTITADQAADLNKRVDQAANEAKQAINNATTASQVEQAQNNGVQKINNINIPSITDAKDAAKTAIDQAAKNKDAEIDASNLSDQEKADLKNEVKVIADTAKKNIDSVDNAAKVNNAMNAGIAAINGIKVATSSDNQNEQSGNNGSTIDNGSGEATNNNGSQAGSVTGATTSQSNGAKISAAGLNGKNNVRINANKQAAQLPQTGNQTNISLGAVGLVAASLAGLFGFTKLGKKKED